MMKMINITMIMIMIITIASIIEYLAVGWKHVTSRLGMNIVVLRRHELSQVVEARLICYVIPLKKVHGLARVYEGDIYTNRSTPLENTKTKVFKRDSLTAFT